MGVVVHLLGDPWIERDGAPVVGPRGRKVWAVLAFLILSERPPSRRAVASLLFSDAVDPLAALRWTLSEIRRVAGWSADELGGDPLALVLREEHSVDLLEFIDARHGGVEPDVFGTLLGSLTFDGVPAFDFCLQAQQMHLDSRQQTRLRDQVLADLATGRLDAALRRARRLVELDPLECRNQEALLRAFAAAGRSDEARRHLARCEDLFARELDAPLPPSLVQAANDVTSSPRRTRTVTATAEARARLDTGRAAIAAGATGWGLDQLRGAAILAGDSEDVVLEAESLLQYGQALAHSAQDRSTRVTAVLHRAIAAATQAERSDFASRASSELAFLHIQTGDALQSHYWLGRAEIEGKGDDHLLAVVAGLRGLALADGAEYERSLEAFDCSIALAQSAGDQRQIAWSLSMAARTHLLRGATATALDQAEESISISQSERWMALLPWPQAQRGEILRLQGRLDEATAQLETAYALACEVEDLCWASVASRSLAAVANDRRDRDSSRAWTERSLEHQLPYVWILAHALEGKCSITRATNEDTSRDSARQLASCAGSSGLREYSARAAIRLADLGDEDAGPAAHVFSMSIDNPNLQNAAASGVPI